MGGEGKPEIKMGAMTIVFIAHCVLQLRDDTVQLQLSQWPHEVGGKETKNS